MVAPFMKSRVRCRLGVAFAFAILCLTPLLVSADEAWYRVQAGDSVQSIAARFGVQANAVRQLNGMTAFSAIAPGQILRVPLPEAPLAAAQSEPNQGTEQTHIVRPGETLQTIGQRYGVDWLALARANNMTNPNLIYVGQVIVLPSEARLDGASATQPGVSLPVRTARGGRAGRQFRLHVTQYGDSLSRIAQIYGLNAYDISALNGFRGDTRLYLGDLVLLPQSAAAAPAVRSFSPSDGLRQHVVQPGESLAIIAARYGRRIAEIAAANNLLNPDRIEVGQVLIIP